MTLIPWPLYRQIIESVPIACVDIALVDNGHVLLVRRRDAPAKGQLWLPGGRVMKGEMLRHAAARKAREEVGVDCHVGPIIHTAETIFEDGPDGVAIHSINACFFLFARHSVDHIQLDDHHDEWTWVDTIDPGWHPYVRACLAAAGLE